MASVSEDNTLKVLEILPLTKQESVNVNVHAGRQIRPCSIPVTCKVQGLLQSSEGSLTLQIGSRKPHFVLMWSTVLFGSRGDEARN
jgi:hypothetical protein